MRTSDKEASASGLRAAIDKALDLAMQYGGTDGGHHKMWVIDQMVRALTGEKYPKWVDEHNHPPGNSDEYEWDCGIAP